MFDKGITANDSSQGSNNGDSPYYRIQVGLNNLVPLQTMDEMVGFWKHNIWTDPQVHHICIGAENGCPGCVNDVQSSRTFSLVMKEEGDDKTPKLVTFGVMIKNQLVKAYEADKEHFVGRMFVIERTGAKKTTRYTVSGTMKMEDVSMFEPGDFPEISKLVGPTTKEKIEELYAKRSTGDDDDAVRSAM